MSDPAQPARILETALAEFADPRFWWELAAIVTTLGIAWFVARLVARRFPPKEPVSRFRLSGFARVLFPLLALLLLVSARAVLDAWMPSGLLKLAIALLTALTVVRAIAYLLQVSFAPGGLVTLLEQLASWLVLGALALHLTGLTHDVVAALDDMSVTVGKQRISLMTVLEGVLSVSVMLVAALALGRLIENRLMRAAALEMNLRIVFSKILRALLLFVGVLIALPLVGIDITFLSVFGGALGVGLGFGLQKIASNYVSGFIILLDRSLRIGDMVTVDNRLGEITAISNRYTVLRSMDGTEAIIPNETLITSTVINHTYSNREVRVNLPVQIAYGSPVERALEILLEVAREHPRVLKHPPPNSFLREFADSGMNLELVVWIADPEEGQLNLRSALNLEIWRRFRAEGIEIPYPRRDVTLLNPPGAPTLPPRPV